MGEGVERMDVATTTNTHMPTSSHRAAGQGRRGRGDGGPLRDRQGERTARPRALHFMYTSNAFARCHAVVERPNKGPLANTV